MSSSFEINFKNNIFFDEYSIERPEPISKKKTKSYKDLKKVALNSIHKRYGAKAKLKYTYTGLIMENLIFNKNTHLVSTFKDYMIWDYIEEFLKRFYRNEESNERVPKFASFYKNYLKFFCVPTFKDIFCNEMIHNYSEKKAELFYNENYKSKKEKNSFQEDYGVLEESESDEESETSNANNNNNIEKTIFNETVKKKIEKYSPINTSMVLPESDTKLKPDDSGLLITSSNETSLVNIMKGMTPPPPPPQSSKPKKNENNKSNDNNGKNKDKNSKKSANKNNHGSENSNSYRMSQRNLIHSSLNKFNSKTLETLLNSQMKNRNRNLLHYNNYSNQVQKNNNNRVNSRDNNRNNSNNIAIKNNLHQNTNNKNLNKNKIMSYIGIYKKKSIPKSRNEDKLPEEIIKSQTQINNFINGSSNSNTNINNVNSNNNIDNLKNNNMKININLNQLGNTLSNRSKNITSINNYNLNYKQSIQKSRNQQQSISINSNTYSKYSFDRINNIKKKINLFKNNNIEFILNQLKFRPFCTLKKSSNRKTFQSNSNRNKKEERNSSKKNNNNVLSNNNNERYSAKTRTISNQHHHDISPNNHKKNFQNSPSAFDFLKKTTEYIRNMNGKGSHSKDIKVYKKSERNCSYNEWQKSYAEDKANYNNNNLKNKNTINKMPFEGILSNNMRGGSNNQKKSRAMNNNGSKHIHNVNININNQINIGGKQFHELFSFSDLVKKHSNNANIKNLFSLSKNKDKKTNYISRNKNQSLDFNAYTNNQINNMNSLGSNKMNSIGDGQNNNIYKTQYKVNNKRFSGNNNKNKNGNKKIRLTNNALFRSMRVINNNNNYNHKIKK